MGILLLVLFGIISRKDESEVRNVYSEQMEYDRYTKEEYYGFLDIPSIDLHAGFYDYDNPLNDVELNIEWIEIPVFNSYFFAAHSGVGKKAYFNYLNTLQIGDDIYLSLENEKLHFQVRNIYRTVKDGDVSISKEEGMIYLTTCDQIIRGYQLVIEGKLIT